LVVEWAQRRHRADHRAAADQEADVRARAQQLDEAKNSEHQAKLLKKQAHLQLLLADASLARSAAAFDACWKKVASKPESVQRKQLRRQADLLHLGLGVPRTSLPRFSAPAGSNKQGKAKSKLKPVKQLRAALRAVLQRIDQGDIRTRTPAQSKAALDKQQGYCRPLGTGTLSLTAVMLNEEMNAAAAALGEGDDEGEAVVAPAAAAGGDDADVAMEQADEVPGTDADEPDGEPAAAEAAAAPAAAMAPLRKSERGRKRNRETEQQEDLLAARERAAKLQPARLWLPIGGSSSSSGGSGSGAGGSAIGGAGAARAAGDRVGAAAAAAAPAHRGASNRGPGAGRSAKRRKTHHKVKLERDDDADMVAETDDSDNDKEDPDSDVDMKQAGAGAGGGGGGSSGAHLWFQCARSGCGKWRKATVLGRPLTRHPICSNLRDTTCKHACDYCGAVDQGDCDSLCAARTMAA
jgi:hypothetical protein